MPKKKISRVALTLQSSNNVYHENLKDLFISHLTAPLSPNGIIHTVAAVFRLGL